MSLDDILDAAEAAPAQDTALPAETPAETPPEAPDVAPAEDLSTPEAIEAARTAFRRERDKAFTARKQLEKRLKKREAQIHARHQELAAAEQARQSIIARLRGQPAEVLDALAQLTQQDPLRLYEGMSLAIAGRKPPDAETSELRSELAKLRAQVEAKDQERQTAAQQAEEREFVAKRTRELVELARVKPHAKILIDRSPESVGAQLVQLKQEAYNNGSPISDQEAVDKLESLLFALAKAANPGTGAGPAQAEKPGKTLTAAQVATTAASRPMTDDEHLQSLLSDESFMRQIFG